MSGPRLILSYGAIVVTLGLGYGMWWLMSPGEDKRKALKTNLPEMNRMTMEETRKRNALVMQALKEASETNDSIAREFGGPFKR